MTIKESFITETVLSNFDGQSFLTGGTRWQLPLIADGWVFCSFRLEEDSD